MLTEPSRHNTHILNLALEEYKVYPATPNP